MRKIGVGLAANIAVQEFAGSIVRLPLALRLALDDVLGRYRRTVLGPLWITLGQAGTILGFVLVYATLFGLDSRDYAVYLAAGLPTWALVSSFLTDMPGAFVASRGFIESFGLPWPILIWRRALGYMFVFFHHIITLVVVMAMMGQEPRLEMLYAIPALAVILISGAGLGLFMAVVGARYRDLQPTMGMLSTMLFMFSPVFWRAEQLQTNTWAISLNPLTYYIRLLRDPLLGVAPPPSDWLVALAGGAIAWCVGLAAYYVGRRRLYHWL